MQNRSRRQVLGLFGATALAGCTAPASMPGDETDPFEGGIGGTGIVGVITGFGSILINGLKVELTAATEVRTALARGAIGDLEPGHSVTIHAMRTRTGYVARKVIRDQLLVGQLTHGRRGLAVNGIPVRREPGSLGSAAIGQRVEVSGVWSPSGVIASRVDPAQAGPDLISGVLSRGAGLFSIGATPVVTARRGSTADGQFIVAVGQMTDGAFEADDLRDGRFAGIARLDQISAEGFLEPVETAPGFRLAGLGHNFARSTRLVAIGRERAIYFGRYDGLFGAERGYLVPTEFAERRRVLSAGELGGRMVAL